jgi:hypothetical protein
MDGNGFRGLLGLIDELRQTEQNVSLGRVLEKAGAFMPEM